MVHAYQLNGYNILLDVNSSLVHVVSDAVYEIIRQINADIEAADRTIEDLLPCFDIYKLRLAKDFDKEVLDEACDEILELIGRDMLFTADIYRPQLEQVRQSRLQLKAMCLHVAHDCNLACRYCFADEGEYHGKRGLMSFETGKKALELLVKSSGTRKNLEVDFFGGEPLMNFDVVKSLVQYGREIETKFNKNFRFTLTTNAVLLNDEITDFLNREMSNVVLSLDGRKTVNDRMRLTRNGRGSYDTVVPNIQRFVELRGDKDYYVRGTFTKNNLDFTKDIEEFLRLGFEKLSLEPVVTTEAFGISAADVDTVLKEYEHLSRFYIERRLQGKPFTFFHFMIDLDAGPCIIKRLKGCGSGTEYVAVAPDGDIYPCHQFVGNEDFIIGNVEKGITNTDVVDTFRQATVYSKDKCDRCFAKFFCSGGCPANSYNFSKDINKVYEIGCQMQRKRVECAIMIKAALAERGVQ